MRKVVLFLVVFLAGLGLLLLLQDAQPTRTRQPPPPESAPPERPDEGFVRVPVEGGAESGIEVSIGGALDATVTAEESTLDPAASVGVQRRLYRVTARDTRPLGDDAFELIDIEMELYDREDGELFARAKAERGVTRIRLVDGRQAFDDGFTLHDVTFELVRGVPVVPMTLRVPKLVCYPERGRLESADQVQVEAQGVQARGTGLEADARSGTLRLVRDGRIELQLERGGSALLETTGVGPLDLATNERDGATEVEIRASEGARVQLAGEQELGAEGETIVILASGSRADPGAERAFRPLSARVVGDALVEGRAGTFRAATADLDFDEQGRPAAIELAGDPRGRVQVAPFLDASRPELYASFVELEGQGPLRVRFGETSEVDLTGPGIVRIPERAFELRAQQSIRGRVGETSGELDARGEVRMVYAGRELETEAIEATYSIESADRAVVDVATEGPTRVRGRDPLGRAVRVDASGGGTFSARDGRITVPLARGVEIEVAGERTLRARANEVRDLDWIAGTFEAEGDVVCETGEGRGTAQRAVSHGGDVLELFGDASAPAVFHLFGPGASGAEPGGEQERGRAQARHLSLDPGLVRGDGDVQCTMRLGDDTYRLESEQASLAFEEPLLGQRTFHVTATDGVQVELRSPGGDASLSSDALELVGSVQERDGEDDRALGRSSLVARGSVVVDYHGRGGLRGEGDEFTVDHRGSGHLAADPGRSVHARGMLPHGRLPYEMTALEIRFDANHIEAIEPVVRVVEEAPPAPPPSEGPGGPSEPRGGGGRPAPRGPARHAAAQPQDGAAQPQAPVQQAAQEPPALEQPPQEPPAQEPPAREPPQEEQGPIVIGLHGQRFWADRRTILLEGDAHVNGRLANGEEWSVSSAAIEIRGRLDELDGERLRLDQIETLEARNGFEAHLGQRMHASGRRLTAQPDRVRMEGEPARFELQAAVWESDWIEFDPVNLLVGTGTGRLSSKEAEPRWSLSYESMQPFDDVDATMLVLRNPVFRERSQRGEREVRAAWALFWIDRQKWVSGGERFLSPPDEDELRVERAPEAPSGTSGIDPRYEELASILKEVYIEGNIEFLEDDRRLGRASAFYLDRVGGLGWIQDANVLVDIDVRDRPETLRIKAGWMRVSADMQTPGLLPTERLTKLRADEAVITTCGFEEPHYVIETGELRLQRNPSSGLGFDFSARKNKARFASGLQIPLPPIDYGTDDEGNPVIGGFEIGDSARFGSVVRATANLPLPRWVRSAVAGSLGGSWEDVRGGTRLNVGYLSSRGFLLGVGQQIRVADKMWLDAFVDAVPDSGRDRGMVRYKDDSSTDLRGWLHGRGRYLLGPDEWVDLAFTRQADQGFQAEFFEREFLRYEERDNYLHWRKAQGQNYYDASAAVRLEGFRTQVEELPAVAAYRGPTPLADVAGHPLLYSADAEVGQFRRRFGRDPFSPFTVVFEQPDLDLDGDPDDFEVLRFDTEHRLEVPFHLGAGLRASPFVSGRFTTWDQGVEEEDVPTRVGAFAGVELGSTLWRRFGNDFLHELAPTLSFKSDVFAEQDGDSPVPIDRVEDPIEGDFVELGLRSVLWRPDQLEPLKQTHLDVEARVTHANGTEDDGLLPLALLGDALHYVSDVPVGLTYDGRYDTEEGTTVYTRTFLGVEPHPKLGVEAGFSQGRDEALVTLYRAASFGLRYRATPKWEIEADYTLSLLDDEKLDSQFLVRRLGHDFVTEVEIADRAGEGVSFGIAVQPLIAWRRARLGLLDNWLGTYR